MTAPGFSRRPLTLDDAAAYSETASAISVYIGAHERFQPESALLEWQEPNFDLANSSIGIFTPGGRLAGYVLFWATQEIPARPWIDWGLHPDFQACGLGAELLRWAEEKGRAVIGRCPPEARVSLRSGAYKGHALAEQALAAAGFKPLRFFYEMRITMRAAPARPAWPAGMELRPYRQEEDLPLLVEVVRDSFSDHFGNIEQSFEKDLADFRYWLNNHPYFDPELVLLAVETATGTVAGCLIGLTQDSRNPDIGYIDVVGVRREFRRRGLAQALLYHSFAAYWQRGRQTVGLEVDGESLTNAVALYERVGMQVHRTFVSYEKQLRDGVELAKVALG